MAWLADACLLAAALFIIDWVAVLGAQYRHTGESAGTFALKAIHPIADLIALGVLLAVAVRAGRAGLAPYLGPARGGGGRLARGRRQDQRHASRGRGGLGRAGRVLPAGGHGAGPGRPVGAASPRRRPGWLEPAGLPGATLAASLAAAVAALMAIGWALNGGSFAEPVVVICAGIAGLALVARITDLLRRERSAAALSAESEQRFRELADRTSDVVLICDRDGAIRYASPAVGEYGYTPAELACRSLAELVHPEDRAARAGPCVPPALGGNPAGSVPGPVGRRHLASCRVHGVPLPRDGRPDRLLITARDVSDQIALRRQVTYLTYHDGLTGLPNRAYVEDRAKDAADRGAAAEPDRLPAQTGAIFIDLDGFTGVNDSVGHGAGDLLLAQAARRLRAAVPPEDTVARWAETSSRCWWRAPRARRRSSTSPNASPGP